MPIDSPIPSPGEIAAFVGPAYVKDLRSEELQGEVCTIAVIMQH